MSENNTFGSYTHAVEYLGENTYDINGCEVYASSNKETRDAYGEVKNLIDKYSELKEENKKLKARIYAFENKGESNGEKI